MCPDIPLTGEVPVAGKTYDSAMQALMVRLKHFSATSYFHGVLEVCYSLQMFIWWTARSGSAAGWYSDL